MQVNFKKFTIYLDIAQTKPVETDVSAQLADGLYQNAHGVEACALALKIYNTQGEEEYSDRELDLIGKYADIHCTPLFILSFKKLRENINQ